MKKFITVALILLFANSVLAQSSSAKRSEFSGVRRNVATVMLFGLGGAVVGLSTLSFYGKPEEHIGNIYFGLAAGLIGGTAYVLVTSESERNFSRDEFSKPVGVPVVAHRTPTVLNYSWEF